MTIEDEIGKLEEIRKRRELNTINLSASPNYNKILGKLEILKRWQADRQKMKAEINSISNSLIESEILRKKQKSRIDALNKERLTIAKNCISCRNEYKKALAESQDTVKAKE